MMPLSFKKEDKVLVDGCKTSGGAADPALHVLYLRKEKYITYKGLENKTEGNLLKGNPVIRTP